MRIFKCFEYCCIIIISVYFGVMISKEIVLYNWMCVIYFLEVEVKFGRNRSYLSDLYRYGILKSRSLGREF